MLNTKNKISFLLDVDGVLADFISGALVELNRVYNRSITIEQYAREFGQWGTYDYYGITIQEFWKAIDSNPDFWINLKFYPWAHTLVAYLQSLGEVTILTAPSEDPDCARQKYLWLQKYFQIPVADVLMGQKKFLAAKSGAILIDDYTKNVDKFKEAGGKAILVPSTWNTANLHWPIIKSTIDKSLETLID